MKTLTEKMREAFVRLDENYRDLRVAYDRAKDNLEKSGNSIDKFTLPPTERFIFKAANDLNGKRYTNVIDVIEDFLKKRLIFQNSRYKDISVIIREMNNGRVVDVLVDAVNELQELEKKQKLKQNANDYDVVIKSSSMIVFKPNNTASSCKLGRGTQWCTAATNSQNYFDRYDERGNLFYIHTKGQKFAFFMYDDRPTVEIFDERDNQINIVSLVKGLQSNGVDQRELDSLFREFKILSDLYKREVGKTTYKIYNADSSAIINSIIEIMGRRPPDLKLFPDMIAHVIRDDNLNAYALAYKGVQADISFVVYLDEQRRGQYEQVRGFSLPPKVSVALGAHRIPGTMIRMLENVFSA